MLNSAKIKFILLFLLIALGGFIYMFTGKLLFTMYGAEIEKKAFILVGLLCASAYYLGIFAFMILHKIYPNFK